MTHSVLHWVAQIQMQKHRYLSVSVGEFSPLEFSIALNQVEVDIVLVVVAPPMESEYPLLLSMLVDWPYGVLG